MNDDAIRLQGATRDFGHRRALDRVTLSVRRGEVFGYLGPNGAGKTTTIKILTGLLRPTAGNAWVCGHSVLDAPMLVKRNIGYVPESGALFEKLTPAEYLRFSGDLYGVDEAALPGAVDRWLHWFALADARDQRIGTLSKGTRQKVCWAAALLHDPEVLVLDEPLNGLDVEAVARVRELLRELSAAGRTVFYSSHLMDVVEKMCTRVAVVHAGRLQAVGTVAEVTAAVGAATLEQALLAYGHPLPARDGA
jgi:ABC-2 type transport system ATP-binding protein